MPVRQRALGDFDGDGNADVLLRDADSGRWHYYPMDGRAVRPGAGEAGLTRDLAWTVAGIGDLDGDGRDDVMLRHDDGRWHYYPLNGRRRIAGAGRANLPADAAWRIVGAPGPGVAANGLRISTAARSPVQPLEAFSLVVAGGGAKASYDLLVDLSGSAGFAPEDTIEVAPVRVAAGRVQLAAPLPEALSASNAARRFAVRLRERGEGALSNALMLTLGETNVPAELAGHPSVILNVVVKAAYEGLDDALLAVEAEGVCGPIRRRRPGPRRGPWLAATPLPCAVRSPVRGRRLLR